MRLQALSCMSLLFVAALSSATPAHAREKPPLRQRIVMPLWRQAWIPLVGPVLRSVAARLALKNLRMEASEFDATYRDTRRAEARRLLPLTLVRWAGLAYGASQVLPAWARLGPQVGELPPLVTALAVGLPLAVAGLWHKLLGGNLATQQGNLALLELARRYDVKDWWHTWYMAQDASLLPPGAPDSRGSEFNRVTFAARRAGLTR